MGVACLSRVRGRLLLARMEMLVTMAASLPSLLSSQASEGLKASMTSPLTAAATTVTRNQRGT